MANGDYLSVMPKSFPAAVVPSYGKLEVRDVPGFAVGEYDAVVRILGCSVCAATDSHLIDGEFPKMWYSPPPFVLGHESVGRVVAVGPKVKHYKVGQLVLRPGWTPPGGTVNGIGAGWGGFATWGIAKDMVAKGIDEGKGINPMVTSMIALPEIPVRDATLFVTWRDCMGCLLDLDVKAGQKVAVFGSGGNGFSFVRFATLLGAKAVMVGSTSRFKLAEKLGAVACIDYKNPKVAEAVKEALGGPADVAIEAAGHSGPVPQMLGSLANGGKLFIFGVPGDLNYNTNIYHGPETFTVVKKNHDTEPRGHGPVLHYYLAGLIDPNDFSQGNYSLDKIHDAFKVVRSKEAFKTTVLMPE